MQDVAVIVNPTAGGLRRSGSGARLDAAIARAFPGVKVQPTAKRGDASRFAAQAVLDGRRSVVAAGGDGTIREVASALAGTDTRLAIVPLGTANVLAHELAIPANLFAALSLAASDHSRCIDVGTVRNTAFVLGASAGIDAAVVHAVRPELKRRWGVMAYALAAVQVIARTLTTRVTADLDGEPVCRDLMGLVIANTSRYAGDHRMSAAAAVDDGLLDAYLIVARLRPQLLSTAVHIALGRADRCRHIEMRQVRSVSVSAPANWPVQVDGDPEGFTPFGVHVVPKALHVVAEQHSSLADAIP